MLRILGFLMIITFFSCSKDSNSVTVGSISFTADGTTYNWTEENSSIKDDYLAMYISNTSPGVYYLNVSNQFSATLHPSREVYLTFEAPTLTATNTPHTYTNTIADNLYPPHYISVSNITISDPVHLFLASKVGNAATTTITSVKNNKVSGTFSATLTRASDQAVINITNGSFANIEIVQ